MNQSNPNISIIIPVYNTGKYLIRCLDSIFNQQFSGTFEVIAVDDASTDNSLQILNKYQDKEVRLKIIKHGINKKQSIARAAGMKAATGDYIMHVDSDDWLLPGALENLFQKCLETDVDVLVFNYVSENSEGKRTLVDRIKKELLTTNKVQVQPNFLGASVNKIVKRSLTYDLICGEVEVNTTEDLLYATEILLKARTICLISEHYYVYYANSESVMHVIKPEQLLENQIIILRQLRLIIFRYKATSHFTNNILNYLEKYIFLSVFQSVFLSRENKFKNFDLIKAFRLFPEMTEKRLNKLELSMMNKYYSLVQVIIRHGFRLVFRIILSDIIKQSFKVIR